MNKDFVKSVGDRWEDEGDANNWANYPSERFVSGLTKQLTLGRKELKAANCSPTNFTWEAVPALWKFQPLFESSLTPFFIAIDNGLGKNNRVGNNIVFKKLIINFSLFSNGRETLTRFVVWRKPRDSIAGSMAVASAYWRDYFLVGDRLTAPRNITSINNGGVFLFDQTYCVAQYSAGGDSTPQHQHIELDMQDLMLTFTTPGSSYNTVFPYDYGFGWVCQNLTGASQSTILVEAQVIFAE